LLLHFDVNKTVIQSDSIQSKGVEEGIREGIAELFWGTTRKRPDGTSAWEWSGGSPSCTPPTDDILSAGTTLINYAQYCKEVCPNKDERKEAVKLFTLVGDTPVRSEMEKLLKLTLKKMQLNPEVRYSKEAEAAGINSRVGTYNMFPTLFHLVATLQRSGRTFGLLFRSFGADHEKIQTEWNAFCELKHPIFSRLIEDLGPMDGSSPNIPDRRIHGLHTLYRDSAGPCLILDTFTNGPKDATWDAWARGKPKPKVDTRNGRHFITNSLKAKTVDGTANIQKWMKAHLLAQGTAAIKDDWAWWQFNGEQSYAGKLLTVIGGKKPTQQIFFDDNIDHNDVRIVDCRDAGGSVIPHAKSLAKLCVKVNPVEAMLDNDYFFRKLLFAQGDRGLDVGASLIGIQKQLTEVEEEKNTLAKVLADTRQQLKLVSEENRKMKMQRRINVYDETELQSILAKQPAPSGNGTLADAFGQGGFLTIADLFTELDLGHCWLEKVTDDSGQEKIVRVIEMVFMKIYFKESILIELHELHSSVNGGQGKTVFRNHPPGEIVKAGENNSLQTVVDSWLENTLKVQSGTRKVVETETAPVYVPDAANQETGSTQAFPIECVVQQHFGSYIIAERHSDVNKDLLSKIGLPQGSHFNTQEKDVHGNGITRFWKWERRQTWEAGTRNSSAPKLDVEATCDKVFKGNARSEEYKTLMLKMFVLFEAQKLCGGFSGSIVIRVQPFDEETGRPEDPCIVKLDAGKAIREEFVNSVNVFKALPDRAARILGDAVYTRVGGKPDGEELGAMRLELAGACWNVPELAMGSSSLLSTFKDLLLFESEQVLLGQKGNEEDIPRPFGNTHSILAETFGPGGVVSSLRKGGDGLRRSDIPLLWCTKKDQEPWYTLKGKEGKFNPYTAKEGEYPPTNAMKKLYKDSFGTEMPQLKKLVVETIKPKLEALAKQAGVELMPLVGLAHGDLNAANIMIDALDAVWVIDFATSVELPLFTDMCKFEMACLFEYSTIPITPKLLMDFASTNEKNWELMNVGDWLRADQDVANILLKKLASLPPERLNMTQHDLEKLIDGAVKESNKKPEKQLKAARAMKARLVADESMTQAAYNYCQSVSNTLLSGDYLKETLDIKGIPLPEGRGSRGAVSLRFFMEVCVSIRRYMMNDITNCLKEIKKSTPGGAVQPSDWLSLQLWLPFLRESFRIIGYRDISPQYKVWSMYHCQKVAQNVLSILEVIQKNMNKMSQLKDFERLNSLLENSAVTKLANQKSSPNLETGGVDGPGLMQMSHWIHYHSLNFHQSDTCTKLLRKIHANCPVYQTEAGFYAPVFQIIPESKDTPVKIEFEQSDGGAPGTLTREQSSQAQGTFSQRGNAQFDLFVNTMQEPTMGTEPATKTVQKIGVLLPPATSKSECTVLLKSRLFRMNLGILRNKVGDQPEKVTETLSEKFNLSEWCGGKLAQWMAETSKERKSLRGSESETVTAALAASSQGKSNEALLKELFKFMTLEAEARDNTGKVKMKVSVVLGVPAFCYPSGANICQDTGFEGSEDVKSPWKVITGLSETGGYLVRSAQDPEQDDKEYDPTPENHTYVHSSPYAKGQEIMVKVKAEEGHWADAEVVEEATMESLWRYKVTIKDKDGEKAKPVHKHLGFMTSGRLVDKMNVTLYEEEVNKLKGYLRARNSSITDSLSGTRIPWRECAPPTLRIMSQMVITSGGSEGGSKQPRRTSRAGTKSWAVSSSSSTGAGGDGGDGEAKQGWNSLLAAVSDYEKAVPHCGPNAYLIQGPPGSGKTCLVCRLIMNTLDLYPNLVPLLIPTSDLVKRTDDSMDMTQLDQGIVHDWFDKYLRMTFGEESNRYYMITQAMKMNRILFIFESLEDAGHFQTVVEMCIVQQIQARQLVIVTSRPLLGGQSYLQDIGESIIHMKLENLNEENKRSVSNARLGFMGMDAYDRLNKKLQESQEVTTDDSQQEGGGQAGGAKQEDVFGNPMMLSMLLCYLQTRIKKEQEAKEAKKKEVKDEDEEGKEEEEGKSDTITAVYRVAMDVMLQRAQSRQQADRHNKDKKIEQCSLILQKMAMEMMRLNKQDISLPEVEALLHKDEKQVWEGLYSAVKAGHAMFLRMTGDEKKSELRFLVMGFQAFFAAKAAERETRNSHDCEALPKLQQLLTEPRWRLMLYMLGEAWPSSYVEIMEKRISTFNPVDGDSFFHIAARAGHRPIFHNLKLFKPENRNVLREVNATNRWTPLHVAAAKGNEKLCQLMLDSSADITAQDNQDLLPMHVAMLSGNFQTAQSLMRRWTENQDKLKAAGTSIPPYRTKKNRNQAEELAKRVQSGMSEEDFKKIVTETFVEMGYFTDKEKVFRLQTMGGLLSTYWIVTNQYELFVRKQPVETRMSHEHWTEGVQKSKWSAICQQSASFIGCMLVFVAISNLGKIKDFKLAFAPEFDGHTEALASILKECPILLPSFAKLDDNLQNLISSALKADFNIGQFAQAENIPASLLPVKQILSDKDTGGDTVWQFQLFKFFVALCGILGMKSLEGSLFMVDKQYTNVKLALDVLSNWEKDTPQEVYVRFLKERQRQAEKQLGYKVSFNPNDPTSTALMRMTCISRVYDKEAHKYLEENWNAMKPDRRKELVKFVNADGILVRPGFLLFRLPDYLTEAKNNQNIGKKPGLAFGLLLDIFEACAKEFKNSEQTVITIFLEELVDHAKSATDPDSFEFTKFEITRASGAKAETQATLHISPWQPMNDEEKLQSLDEKGMKLASDTINSAVREQNFKKQLPEVFPELRWITEGADKNTAAVTMGALLAVYWTASDQWEPFARSQQEKKLTEKSWASVLELADCARKHEDTLNAVYVVIALHGLGNMPKFQAQLAPGVTNPKQVMSQVLEKCPKVLPSYWRLLPTYRDLAKDCLSRDFNFDQMLKAESVAASVTTVKEMLETQNAGTQDFDRKEHLKVFIYILFAQISATESLLSVEGSLYMTQERWDEFAVGMEALLNLEKNTEQATCDTILKSKAATVGLKFDDAKPETKAVARLACLCRAISNQEGAEVQKGFDELEPDEQTRLTKYLTADGINVKPGFILKDGQKFLMAAVGNKEVGLTPALKILLKVYEGVSRGQSGSSNRLLDTMSPRTTTKQLMVIDLGKLAVFSKEFKAAVTFQDMPFELKKISDTEMLVIPKVWIPVKNKAVLRELSEKGEVLAQIILAKRTGKPIPGGDTSIGPITEKTFKNQVERTFPELAYFNEGTKMQKDQTMRALLSVFWLLTNDQNAFVRGQPEEEILSKASWQWIQEWITESVRLPADKDSVDAMLTFMAIHALGKIPEFREELAPHFDAHMHDVALAHILVTQTEVVPSFARLDDKWKALIVDSLSVDFQFSQFLQGENIPANLVVVKDKIRKHGDDGFGFFCFRIFAQMCGKLGAKGTSLCMTETQFLRFRPGLDALQQLRNSEPGWAYNTFLLLQGSKALSRFTSPEHQALSRLLCLGSATDYAGGDQLIAAFDKLGPRERAALTQWLTADGIVQRPGYVLGAAPELLKNAQENPLVGLTAAFRMLVRVQERCVADKSIYKVYVHLGDLADWARDAGGTAGEFDSATLEVRREDQDDTRIFTVEVLRPAVRHPSQAQQQYTEEAGCGKILGTMFCLLLCLVSMAGVAGWYFFPEKVEALVEPIEPTLEPLKPYVVEPLQPYGLTRKVIQMALGGFLLLWFLFIVLCCKGCRCCRCSCLAPSRRVMCCEGGSRPLMCHYTLLEPTDSEV
jgi:hypothetical protein